MAYKFSFCFAALWRGVAAAALPALLAASAVAQTPAGVPERPPPWAAADPQGGAMPSIRPSPVPLGDPGGLQASWAARGVDFTVLSTSEVLGNPMGGVRQGAIHAGRIEATLALDLGRFAGFEGVSAFVNAFQIHDTGGLRDRTFRRLITVSNIEAYPTTRLSELWLERRWDAGLSLRIGQLSADGEFFAAETGKPFLSNDWPTITGANLPSGGPAYPLATPGLRLRYDSTIGLTALVAAFNGDPGDQRAVNWHGANLRIGDPPLVMAELQLHRNHHPDARGRAASIKIGGYRHFGRFDDRRFGDDGLHLADPGSSGIARRLRGNGGTYAVAEQQLYRPDGGGPTSGVSVYARLSASPSDRNPIGFWADGGVVLAGLIPGRPHDLLGAGFIYARLGRDTWSPDRDPADLGERRRTRSGEGSLELSYQYRISPGWIVQPDVQYVFAPGGGLDDPSRSGRPIEGGLVLGLRSTIVH